MVLLGPPEFLREEWEQVKRALVPVAYRRRAETPAANVHAFAAIRRIRAPAPWDTSDENVWIGESAWHSVVCVNSWGGSGTQPMIF